MKSHFSSSFFKNNRYTLRHRIGTDAVIVIAANGLLQRTGDSSYPFQQESNFWYLTGLEMPDLVLVMTRRDEFLIVPDRSPVRQAFDGSIDLAALGARSGITEAETEREGWKRLRHELDGNPEVYTAATLHAFDASHGMWANPANTRVQRKIRQNNHAVRIIAIDEHLAEMRVNKQPAEIAAIQSAIDITSATLADLRASFSGYVYEYEVEALLSQGFRSRGASGHSFSPIVANGPHATVLHNVANNGKLERTDLTVLDVGAEVEHYAADITRTIAAQKPSKRQQNVYEAVLETQEYALSLLAPGTLAREYERAVALHIGDQLKKLGLITTVDFESVRRYYPHATSHFLGLDVHDVGDYNQPFAPGMVLTCEPGIYIPEEGIGVRIEDDILITENGRKILSEACPRALSPVQ